MLQFVVPIIRILFTCVRWSYPWTLTPNKYEFILPNFNITKNIDTGLDGFLTLTNTGYNKLFNTNVNEKVLINDLSYKSLDTINNLGFISNFEILMKNFNADSENSSYLKNKTENDL